MKRFLLVVCLLMLTSSYVLAAADSSHKIGPILSSSLDARERSSQVMALGEETSEPELVKVVVSIGDDYLSDLPNDVVLELSEKVILLGGRIGNRAYNNVQVWIPYDKLETLAQWSKIKNISAPIVPDQTNVTSGGLTPIGATGWQQKGVGGRGVNVAVIDIGFNGYSKLLGTELPDSVDAYYFGEPSSLYYNVHGTACAEIVHDVAPEASLAMLNVGNMGIDFHNAVSWMKNNNIDIASSSIGLPLNIFAKYLYYSLYGSASSQDYFRAQYEQLMQKSEQVAATVRDAVNAGITWVQAAGNDGQKKWSGSFLDTDGNGYHNFSDVENYNLLNTAGCVGQELYVTLIWGVENEFNSSDDYDLIILDQNNKLITYSSINQSLEPLGVEAIKFTVSENTNYKIVIKKNSGATQKLALSVGGGSLTYNDPGKTVNFNQPAPVTEAITVGAVYPQGGKIAIAPYSSQGPGNNGEMKPDVVAPAGVRTVSYGDIPFHGTSAATPHVAGLCALLKQQYPNDTPVQLKTFLQRTAIDYGVAGPDYTYGYGLAYLPLGVFNQPALYFSHISSKPGDKNTLGVINTDGVLSLEGKLKAFNHFGKEVASKNIFLAQHGRREFSVEKDFPGGLGISYLTLEYVGGEACGYMIGQSADSSRSYMIPATSTASDGDMFVPHVASDGAWNTEVSLLNTGNTTKNLSLKFDNGVFRQVVILPNEHKKINIRDFFGGEPQPEIHSVKILGASDIIGTEVFYNEKYAAGISLEPNLDKDIYFPHVANNDYWWTGLVAYNPSIYSASLSVIPFTDSGEALPSKQVFLQGESQYIGTIKSLGLDPKTAWFKIESSGDIHSFELFGSNGKQMAGYSTVGIKTDKGMLPKLERSGGWTGVSFVNPNSTSVNIVLFAYDDNGSVIASNSFELEKNGKIVDTAENLFSYGIENFDPSKLDNATYIVFYASSKVIGFQMNGSVNGTMLESIPALSLE